MAQHDWVEAMSDELEKSLRNIQSELPKARLCETRDEKVELIRKLGGPRTAENIRKAMQSYPHARIPFLFSSLDAQLVVDVMANDLDELIAELKQAVNKNSK